MPGVPTRKGGAGKGPAVKGPAVKGQGRPPDGALGTRESRVGKGRAGKGRVGEGRLPEGGPDGHVHLPARTVHQAWRAYRIAHPQHRGPHIIDGVYLLQGRCSDGLVRSHRGDDVWGHVSPPFVQPSPSMFSDWAECSLY